MHLRSLSVVPTVSCGRCTHTHALEQLVCTGQPPSHRWSYSTLSFLRATSISLCSTALQSGHKTATTQSGMCVEFLLSSPSERLHPRLQPLLLAPQHTHLQRPITCHLVMCCLPLEVLIKSFCSVTKLALDNIKVEI